LRALFDALLSVEYVLKEEMPRRGAAYVVAEVHARLRLIDQFDPSTQQGKQLAASLRKDVCESDVPIPRLTDADDRRRGLLSRLSAPLTRATRLSG
jgi:hypothetical protein